jgi:hypothetical protein
MCIIIRRSGLHDNRCTSVKAIVGTAAGGVVAKVSCVARNMTNCTGQAPKCAAAIFATTVACGSWNCILVAHVVSKSHGHNHAKDKDARIKQIDDAHVA